MMKTTVLLWCAVGITSAFSVPLQDDITPRVGEACGYDSCTEAEEGLLNVHIVPHTHDDVGWLKTVDQYYYGSRNSIQKAGVQYILDSVIKELWEDPKRRFIYVETAFFWKWWVRQTDSVRHKVHVLVRQGRLQFVGGAWSMNDEAASHYQSTIDQFTWGLGKLNQTFGACGVPRVGWQIDPFGHSREFASLLAAMKYDGLFLGRIDYQDKSARKQGRSMEMVWRGDDDLGKPSDLFTGVLYNTYSPPPNFCFDVLCSDEPIIDDPDSPMFNVEARINEFLSYVKGQSTVYKTKNVIVTMGGDFTYQDATMWYNNLDKLIENANLKAAKEGLNIKLFYSTPDCYLKAVHDANPTLPTKQDDFFPYASDPNSYWTGYFTSRPTTKFFERQANSYLQMAKQLQVLAGLEDHNRFVLNELKSAMGVMQHHDAITGTEKQHVTHDYERLLDEAIDDALIIPRQAFNKMMQGDPLKPPLFRYDRCRLNESSCDTSENSHQFVVTVYNHLGWNANESIRIPVVEGTYAVYAPNGEQIVSQIVDIPKEVQNIPTRHSKATHEIVFIAYLKPVSYKSYYIKRVTKLKRNVDPYLSMDEAKQLKRKTDYYTNINNYWTKIKAKPYVEIKNIEDESYRNPDLYETIKKEHNVSINRKSKPIYEPGYYRDSKFENPPKDVDLDVLKDGKNFFNRDIEELEKIIDEGKHLPKKVSFRDGMEKAVLYPSLNDEEMRMLADDPMIVEMYSDEAYLENDHIKLRLESGDITHVVFPDGTSTKFSPKFFYYPGCVGDNKSASRRSSGAYIFRPNATVPFELESNYTEGPKGPVVNEIRGVMSENVASTIRLYNGLNYIEHDWVVGPINIEDNEGKEFIVKYMTDIVNNGEFYTDSNGRQMLKRKLNKRPQWNLTLAEPVAGNYYPVTNNIAIEDGNNRLAVTPDRSEGGASLQEGEVELMLHRRLLQDDAFGVGEALNETANGKGLVVRGKHRIFISKSGSKDYLQEKKQVIQYHLQPQVFVSDAADVSLDDWMKLTKAHSWVNELPNGIHLLTLEPWYSKSLLLRLENYLETTDSEVTAVDVDLKAIFKDLEVESFKETSLAANQWLDDSHKWHWVAENEFSDRFNKAYGSFDAPELAKGISDVLDDGFKVKIKAKEIRTFVVSYSLKSL